MRGSYGGSKISEYNVCRRKTWKGESKEVDVIVLRQEDVVKRKLEMELSRVQAWDSKFQIVGREGDGEEDVYLFLLTFI